MSFHACKFFYLPIVAFLESHAHMPMHISGGGNGPTRESLSLRGANLPTLLDKISEALAGRSFVSAFALTGSRARGDNFAESDYDVLIVDTRDLPSPFLERLVLEGESIDLEHAPLEWLTKRVPCDLDQAIRESRILADRDGFLASAQKWSKACNNDPTRMAGRMGEVILRSEVLLSRAHSALSRLDYESCILHGKMAAVEASRVLLEAKRIPYQPSRFAGLLRSAAEGMDLSLIIPSSDKVKDAMGSLRMIMQGMVGVTGANKGQPVDTIEQGWPFAYYSNGDFARRTLRLLDNLLAEDHLEDLVLYTQINGYKILEAYQQLLRPGTMVDFVTMLRQIKAQEQNPGVYGAAIILYDIQNPSKAMASEVLKKTRGHVDALNRLRTYSALKAGP